MEIHTDLETADPLARAFRVVLTGDNVKELPAHVLECLNVAESCAEILAALTTAAVILDRKQAAFQAGLREATLTRKLERTANATAEHFERRKADRCPEMSCRARRRCMTPEGVTCLVPTKGQFIPDHGEGEGDDNAFAGETAPDRRQGERRGKIGNRRGLGQPGPPLGHAERRTRFYGRREGNDRRVPPVGNQ